MSGAERAGMTHPTPARDPGDPAGSPPVGAGFELGRRLPPGRGAALAAAMKRLVEELRAALPAAFERDEYRARHAAVEQQFRQRSEQAFGALQQRAQTQDIALLRTPTGLALAPSRDGK